MRAGLVERYGTLLVRDVEQPTPGERQVLVRVHASSLNAVDWYGFTGRPYAARVVMGLRRPKSAAAGSDFAGVVEASGAGVAGLEPGDEVFGCGLGAFADFLVVEKGVARKPAGLTFAEAAAVPIAGLTALQGLRDHAAVQPGQKVLVNGAAGGVGTLAVQVAKALGAEVDAVCSTRNVDQAHELGADRVFDYTREDFTRSGLRYDVLFDNAGTRSWFAMRRVLVPHAKVLLVGGPRTKALLGPLGHIVRMRLASLLGSRTAISFIAKPNASDLTTLAELIEAGQVRPVIERSYPLAQVAEAMRTMSDGHARAKIVVTVEP